MRVTYFGATGTIRMVYLNVAMYGMKGEHVVELLVTEKWVDKSPTIDPNGNLPTAYFKTFDHYSTLVLINLAPGEYLEWSKDAERS
jgi:hypothetical protein